jgi:GcrA cell cycle regulator
MVTSRNPERAAAAQKLRAQGLTIEAIGDRLTLSTSAVRRHIGGISTPRGGTPWDDVRVELLKKLWREGFSGSQAAKMIGGVSRCAVIAKVHRLGLTRSADLNSAQHGRAGNSPGAKAARKTLSTPRPTQPAPRRVPAAAATEASTALRPGPTLAPAPIELAPSPLSVNALPFMERGAKQCAWPIEIDGEMKACCDPVVSKGWCAVHLKRGTVPTPPRMKDTHAWAKNTARRFA